MFAGLKITCLCCIVFIITTINNVIIGCTSLTKRKTSRDYFSSEDSLTIEINLKNKKDSKTNDFGDVYYDIFTEKISNSKKKERLHLLFFYNEEKESFSNDITYYDKSHKFIDDESYLPTLNNIMRDKYGNIGEFELDGIIYYLLKTGSSGYDKEIYAKVTPSDSDNNDELYSLCNVVITKNYEKVKITYSPSDIPISETMVYKIFFKKIERVLTILVNKEAVQGSKYFKINVSVDDGNSENKENKHKQAHNGSDCKFDIVF